MFKTLLIKEWKDKAVLVAFGLAIMGLMLTAFLVSGGDKDLRELIPATFLIFFFPVFGAMLGAGAFESEFRDGAWTYLLSRPVRKGTIWSAKLVALLSILAGFWLAFIGLMAVVPGLGEVVSGFKLPEMLGSGLEFLPLILLSSLFFFSIAFSLSILTDKQLSLVFGTLFLGLVLEGALLFLALPGRGRGNGDPDGTVSRARRLQSGPCPFEPGLPGRVAADPPQGGFFAAEEKSEGLGHVGVSLFSRGLGLLGRVAGPTAGARGGAQ